MNDYIESACGICLHCVDYAQMVFHDFDKGGSDV
jgi:hypothetical protein